jgi:3-keto-5-aminohexanoate cleavage enzyme
MGPDQFRLLVTAIALGDHVRVGTEDYPFDVKGNLATTHELVSQIAAVAKAIGRPIATPDQARDLIGLRGGAT